MYEALMALRVRMSTAPLVVFCASLLGLTQTGCIERYAINAQVSAMQKASGSIDTMHDFEVARSIAEAGLGQLEGLYMLAPENDDLLLLLTRGWGAATFAFTVDAYEEALAAGDDRLAEYHLLRTRRGFERAKYFGLELFKRRADGFEDAKVHVDPLRAWLTEHFDQKEDAELLAWLGFAWGARVAAGMDVPEIVAELYVGITIIERSIELDPTAGRGLGHTVMGLYHSHVEVNLDKAKDHFERAIAVSDGKYLPPVLSMASGYYCAKGDRDGYFGVLERVLSHPDPLPKKRLQNTVTMRRAYRYREFPVFQELCAWYPDPAVAQGG